MLSVVEALNKYRHFLLGPHFIIKSDHISLRFINSLKNSSVGRLYRWFLQIQGFDFELQYQKGSSHVVADSLSRCEYPECTDNTMDKLFLDQNIHAINQTCNKLHLPTTETRSEKKVRNMDNVCIISHKDYNESVALMEVIRDLIVKRVSYLLLPGSQNKDIKISQQGHIHL